MRPATLMLPVRPRLALFAAALATNEPLPEPLPPLNEMNELMLVAVQAGFEQPGLFTVTVTVAAVAALGNAIDCGETVKVQVWSAVPEPVEPLSSPPAAFAATSAPPPTAAPTRPIVVPICRHRRPRSLHQQRRSIHRQCSTRRWPPLQPRSQHWFARS